MLNHRLIKNLQNKSEGFRKAVMWFGVFSVMAVIFTFWILTFPSSISAPESSEADIGLNNKLPDVWQSLKEQINNLKNLWQR